MAEEKEVPANEAAERPNYKGLPGFLAEVIEKNNLAKSETPRANIIVAASYVDELLTKLLKKLFIKPPSSEDKLFDSFGPIYNFGSKIEVAYRAGLISSDFAFVLHQIRKMRDECAHSHEVKDFNMGRLKDLIDSANSKGLPNNKNSKSTPEKLENTFMVVYLNLWLKINNTKEVTTPKSEFTENK
jgi:hypothetical protein